MPDECQLPVEATLLAFDVGERKLGIAVGQRITGTATPLQVLPCSNGQPDWQRVAALIDEWQPTALVVGIPLTEQGDEQPATRLARKFANRLRHRFQLSIFAADERYTSAMAGERFALLRANGSVRRQRGKSDDAVAAQLILERWMTNHSTPAA